MRPSTSARVRGGLVLFALLLASAPGARAQFRVPTALPVPGSTPTTVAAAGDFNGDGLLDLAVGYNGSAGSGVATFLRSGPATFAPPVVSPGLPAKWKQVVATDLNLDGRTDLLVVVSGGVFALIAGGGGGFTSIPLDTAPPEGVYYEWSGVAYADFDGDGHADIATTVYDGYSSTELKISLGDGQGGFGPWTETPIPLSEDGQIAAGDLDGDTDNDLMIGAGGVEVFLNNGGAFGLSSVVPTGGSVVGLAATDLDGDGDLDVVAAHNLFIVVAEGNGTGAMAITFSAPGPSDARDAVVADFDADGAFDLAVSGDGVWTYRGDGTGAFAPPARYAAQGGLWPIDLDGNGLLDLAAGHLELINVGGGVLDAPRQFLAGQGIVALASGDMNGDGRLDVVTANYASDNVAVLINNGDGTLADPRLAAAGDLPWYLALGDWNGDGRLDDAAANLVSHDISILLGDGTGGLAPAPSISLGALDTVGVVAGDLNQDGRSDLAVATQDSSSGQGAVAIFLATGGGSFVAGSVHPVPGAAKSIGLGAFNPDVRPDVAVGLEPPVSWDPRLATLLGDGAGSLVGPLVEPGAPISTPISVGDLNGDARADLVVNGDVLLGDGTGLFTTAGDIPGLYGDARIGDFDRNGSADMALTSGDVLLAVGDGTGRFALLNRTFPVGGAPGKAASVDLNSDGYPDLAVGVAGSVVTVLLNEAMPPGADVSLAVSHSPDPLPMPGPLTLTAVVANQGPLTAAAPVLTVELPPLATFVSSNPGPPTCTTSQQPQQNVILTCVLGDLNPGGSVTVDAALDTNAPAGYLLPFDARVATSAPVDPDPLDNHVVHNVPVGSPPDLEVGMADSADPVAPGATFDYLIDVKNVGGSDSTLGTNLIGTLDSVIYQGSNPPICTGGVYLSCGLPAIAPDQTLQIAVTVVAGTFTSVTNSVTVDEPLDLNAANDGASEETQGDLGIRRHLLHGDSLRESFPASNPAERLYYVLEAPHSSYEVAVDALSGDVAAPGQSVLLQRLGSDLSLLQDSAPAGAGASRTLSFENPTGSAAKEVVRVRSTGCATGCGPGDAYRIRAWETTATIPRFNTEGTQFTVLVLENRTSSPVQGNAWLWDESGALVGSVPFSLGGHQSVTTNLASVAPGRKGAVKISHDGPLGAIQGKCVAAEPSTGFVFDTGMRTRPR